MQSLHSKILHGIVLLTALLLVLSLTCSREIEEPVLARVGDHTITVEDFLSSYELQPRPGARIRTPADRRRHLDHLIENQLLAIFGTGHNYHHDPRLAPQIKAITRDVLVRQLYQAEVANRVSVSEAEIRAGFARSKIKIRARHLFVKSRDQADSLLALLRQGATFQQLARHLFRDTTLANNGGDLGYFSFGDMDPDFEQAAYRLKVGEVSTPVKTRWGFHIIKVEDRIQTPLITESDYQTNRHKIERIIRKRKEIAAARQYVKALMEPKKVVARASTINFLVHAARRINRSTRSLLPDDLPRFRDEEINSIREQLRRHGSDMIAEFEGGGWTLNMFLEKIREKSGKRSPGIAPI